MWTSWHDNVGRPMRGDYARMVEIANDGAKELGYADTGAMWRSKYDMTPDEFAAMNDRLWAEVEAALRRAALLRADQAQREIRRRRAARDRPDPRRPARQHVGAGMGQHLRHRRAEGRRRLGYDLDRPARRRRATTPVKMVKTGEGFYTSLGFAPLPADLLGRARRSPGPRDREVVCHASAWDLDNKDDLRIKMCIKVNADDFVTIHHELGPQLSTSAPTTSQPFLYLRRRQRRLPRGDRRLHRAVDHARISGADRPARRSKVPTADKDTGLLLRQALDKIAFLPFGLLVDKWRWGVFDGSITPGELQRRRGSALRLQYQGIVPPVPRPADATSIRAPNIHIPGNTPYARYFLARHLQFQFYKAACDMSGWKGPLHRCSFYGNKEVGATLNADAGDGPLAALAGRARRPSPARARFRASRCSNISRRCRRGSKQQNRGKQCGW